MADISIPGVSDKYKTNDYIEALMKKERLPLTREQETLDRYKEQQSAWNGINQKMTSLRTNTKTLYSFENPFNNKLADSTDENSITATPGRDAAYESFKVDVIKNATADRFLSAQLDKDFKVSQGKYTFKVGEKTISFNWKGGKLNDFVSSLNKRGANTIKASLIGVSGDKKSLLIESLKTGEDNRLIFLDDALDFALKHEMLEKTKEDLAVFPENENSLLEPPVEFPVPETEQAGLPDFSNKDIQWDNEENRYIIPPRAGFELKISEEITSNENSRLEFSYYSFQVEDITEELNLKMFSRPELQDAGKATYKDITVFNDKSQTSLPPLPLKKIEPVESSADFFIKDSSGKEYKIEKDSIKTDSETGENTVTIDLKNYTSPESLILRNRNTGEALALSKITSYDRKKSLGYKSVHPVSEAGNAVIKYEGITITRPENKIDDVIPNVTLNIHAPTEKTATITIKPDKDSAKDALIQFVGTYNQTIAEINILSENKPEIISELDYFTEDEKESASKRLGMFQGDFSLSNGKATMQNIIAGNYPWSENATITMLNQIGISTRAAGGGGGYTAGQFRGYLEINEKKLDEALENDLDQIKNIFGFDSDGDLIIDSGIGYSLDRQLTSWVQKGGIISSKTATLDGRIKNSESKIQRLETQLASKEAQLREKYGQMEGTLNSLQSQSNSLSNFANSGNRQ